MRKREVRSKSVAVREPRQRPESYEQVPVWGTQPAGPANAVSCSLESLRGPKQHLRFWECA